MNSLITLLITVFATAVLARCAGGGALRRGQPPEFVLHVGQENGVVKFVFGSL